MTTTMPEPTRTLPGEPVTLDPDLEAAVRAVVDTPPDDRCEYQAFFGPVRAGRVGIPECQNPATWILTASCGCRFRMCDVHAGAFKRSIGARVVACGLSDTGCPNCSRCRKPICAGRERIEPIR